MVDTTFLFTIAGKIMASFLIFAIWFLICTSPIFIIVKLIIREKHKSEKLQKEMFDKAHDLAKQKTEQQEQEALPKKIVRCSYCGKQTRFGTGTCPHCGGILEKPIQ